MTDFFWRAAKGFTATAMLGVGAMELGPEAADIAARTPVAVASAATLDAASRWAGLLAVLPVGWALAAALCIGRPAKRPVLIQPPATHRRTETRHAAVACHRRAALARSREVAAYRNLMECRMDRLEAYLAGACHH